MSLQVSLNQKHTDRIINGDFDFKHFQNVVNCVQASRRLDTQKLTYLHAAVDLQMSEFEVLFENVFVLHEVNGQGVLSFAILNQLADSVDVFFVYEFVYFQGFKIPRKSLVQSHGCFISFNKHLLLFFFLLLFLLKLWWHRIWEDHEKWWQEDFSSWNKHKETKWNELNKILLNSSYFLLLDRIFSVIFLFQSISLHDLYYVAAICI